MAPGRIDFTVLKMAFKAFVQKNTIKLPSQQKKQTRTSNIKLILTSEPNYESSFLKYAATLYQVPRNQVSSNQVPKQIQDAEIYCDVAPKLKKYII